MTHYIEQGEIMKLPSGNHVMVLKIHGESHPDVTVKYIAGNEKFELRLEWLAKYGKTKGAL